MLISPFDRSIWLPREHRTAACELEGHLAPNEECTCGLYAARTPHLFIDTIREIENSMPVDASAFVFGRVSLWGKTIEHEHGFRAQYAYPQALYVHPRTLDVSKLGLSKSYGVEVALYELIRTHLGVDVQLPS